MNKLNKITNQIVDHTDKFINEDKKITENYIPLEYGTLIPQMYKEIKKVLQLTENEKIILLKGQEVMFKKGEKKTIFDIGTPNKFFSELLVVTDRSKICYISGFWNFCIDKQKKNDEHILPIIFFNENIQLSDFLVKSIQLFDDIVFKSSDYPWLYDQEIIKPLTVLFYLSTHIQKMIMLHKTYNNQILEN